MRAPTPIQAKGANQQVCAHGEVKFRATYSLRQWTPVATKMAVMTVMTTAPVTYDKYLPHSQRV